MKFSIEVEGKNYQVRRYLQKELWTLTYRGRIFTGRSPELVERLFKYWVKSGCPQGDFELKEDDLEKVAIDEVWKPKEAEVVIR